MIWLLFLFLAEGPLQAEVSLLHTPQEVASILEARESFLPSSGQVHLQGIFYVTPLKWSVWVNGVLYDPDHLPDYFTIKEVTPQGVRFSFGEDNFFLRPNEIFAAKKKEENL